MPTTYSLDFKKGAISLVEDSGLSVAKAAKDLGVGVSTLDKWLRSHRERAKDPNALSETELAELKRLRKENQTLRIERDLLKKMATYFAKDSEPR
jgi:transposase